MKILGFEIKRERKLNTLDLQRQAIQEFYEEYKHDNQLQPILHTALEATKQFGTMTPEQQKQLLDTLEKGGVRNDVLMPNVAGMADYLADPNEITQKFKLEPDYRKELLTTFENIFLSDSHIGNALKTSVSLMSANYRVIVKNKELNKKRINDLEYELQRVNIGSDLEDNSKALTINNMTLQLVLAGAISRKMNFEFIDGKLQMVGSIPINNKYVNIYVNESLNAAEFILELSDIQHIQSDSSMIGLNKTNGTNADVVNPLRYFGINEAMIKEGKAGIISRFGKKYVPLKRPTYCYRPHLTLQDNPIGLPPLLQVINAFKLEQNMLGGLYTFISRFSTVSFVKLLLAPPAQADGETDAQYKQKAKDNISTAIEKLKVGLREGYFVGFQGIHEIDTADTLSDSEGFNKLYRWALINKMSGANFPLFYLGVDTTISDSLAKILAAKLSAEIKDYEVAVGDVIRKMLWTYALLKYNLDLDIEIKFSANSTVDVLRDAQAEKLNVDITTQLYQQGLISQDEAAKRLGYDKPDMGEPRPLPEKPQTNVAANVPNKAGSKPKASTQVVTKKPSKAKANNLEAVADVEIDSIFDVPCTHKTTYQQLLEDTELYARAVTYEKFADEEEGDDSQRLKLFALLLLANKLQGSSYAKFVNAYKKKIRSLIINGATDDAINEAISAIFELYESSFDFEPMLNKVIKRAEQLGIVVEDKEQIREMFTIFGARAIYSNLLITKLIGVLNTYDTVEDILNGFVTSIEGSEYLTNRVINTFVNRMYNQSTVSNARNSGISQVMVVAAMSATTCAYCATMSGTVYNTADVYGQYALNSNPNNMQPFINTMYRTVSALPSNLSDVRITLPFHPNCMCRYVPVV